MTRLFNLESYSELCTHANLYQTEINSPVAYKNFLDKYKERGYRNDSLYLQELTIQDELIPLKYLGVNLSPESDLLYVVGDRINSLSLRNFLRSGEKYIYQSVYHYWNYRQQIANNLDLNNPVVFIDLGSLSDEPYCSLKFEQWSNTIYQIPIIDNRGEVSNDFKLPLDIKDIHNNIYHALAYEILSRNFPQLATNKNTVEHLKLYLQKIEVFKLAQSQNESSSFSIIVELLDSQKVYYKSINIDIALLEDIVINKIDIKAIARFTRQHSKYSFVLISDYNFLPKFRKLLNSPNIFIRENHLAEFLQIWQEKQQQNFPLFGQYLDKIKFQIKRKEKIEWIEVLSKNQQEHIYYEGDSETKLFIARIQDTGQDYFKLKNSYTILPIKINDLDYCINGITQEYQILHPLSESKTEKELEVRIEFIVKLGSVPELKVTDKENKYTIEAQLRARQEIVQLLDHIPLETILEHRRQKNCFLPSPEQLQQFHEALSPIKNVNNFHEAMKFGIDINRAYEIIHRTNNNTDLFLDLHPNCLSDKLLKTTINSLNNSGILNEVKKYIKGTYNFKGNREIEAKKFIKKIIMFLGKTYKLSNSLTLKSFFEPSFIELAYQKVGGEYFLFLSRVALTKEFQLVYCRLFYNSWVKNQPLYQLEKYLWGYSRILLWYFKFDYQNNINFQEHFSSILNYLKTEQNLIQGYKQNAFLSLIYLFTFRDPSLKQRFCVPDSNEYNLAKNVLKEYSDKDKFVKLKAVSDDKSLNKYFEELIEGKSSHKFIGDLFSVN